MPLDECQMQKNMIHPIDDYVLDLFGATSFGSKITRISCCDQTSRGTSSRRHLADVSCALLGMKTRSYELFL